MKKPEAEITLKMRVEHKYMLGLWKGEVIAAYGDARKVRWDGAPRRDSWVQANALKPLGNDNSTNLGHK